MKQLELTASTERAIAEAVDSDSWCTDRHTARKLGHFSTDPCSNPRSWIQCDEAFSLENGHDGLAMQWGYSVFWNGPYSNPLPWSKRLAKHWGIYAALVKLDPTTEWWSLLIDSGATYAPFKKRLKFERPDKPPLTANFPSALVYRGWMPSDELLRDLHKPVTP